MVTMIVYMILIKYIKVYLAISKLPKILDMNLVILVHHYQVTI